ncbi:hypothetical protein PMAYCL1PPCAC_03224, partial [Pristionchus mayeri]
MSKSFYIGIDDKAYGPVTEFTVGASESLTSEVIFRISVREQWDKEQLRNLDELIDPNDHNLPFHFSKENVNRCKQLEQDVQLLKQKVESLTTSFNEPWNWKREEITDLIQNQIAPLFETSIVDRLQKKLVDALSNGKDNPQQNKIVEIEKKVAKQEESLASIKKEISTVKIKCDRNNQKLENLIEQQKETDDSVNGAISTLKSSQMRILDSIKSVNKISETMVNQVKITERALQQVQKEFDELKMTSLEHMQRDINEYIDGEMTRFKAGHADDESIIGEETIPAGEKQLDENASEEESEKETSLPCEYEEQIPSGSESSSDPLNQEHAAAMNEELTKFIELYGKTELTLILNKSYPVETSTISYIDPEGIKRTLEWNAVKALQSMGYLKEEMLLHKCDSSFPDG